jgi:dTDP-4-amino-4,6-dideoxygalactose transaminase
MLAESEICRNPKLLYCGSEGMTFSELFHGLMPAKPEMPPWEQFCGRTVLPTFLGRVAIWQLCNIWRLEPGDEILMPAYNCGTEVDPFLVYGCKVVLYRVDEKTRIDVPDIMRRRTRRTKVVYVTHFFGWPQDLRELARWCQVEQLRLVEDCALALFSSGPDGPLGLQGDAAIFSLGKSVPVPAGGVLTLRAGRGEAIPRLVHWPRGETCQRTMALLRMELQRKLERFGVYSLVRKMKTRMSRPRKANPTYREVPEMPGEYYLDDRIKDGTMPPLVQRALHSIEPGVVKKRRRENYLALEQGASGIPGLTPLFNQLPEGTCPLYFPMIGANRGEIVQALDAHGVSTNPFWEGYHRSLTWAEFPEARFLKDNVFTLPVNQSLSPLHMKFLLDLLGVLSMKVSDRKTK